MNKIMMMITVVVGAITISGCSGSGSYPRTYTSSNSLISVPQRLPGFFPEVSGGSYQDPWRRANARDDKWDRQLARERAEDYCTVGSRCYAKKIKRQCLKSGGNYLGGYYFGGHCAGEHYKRPLHKGWDYKRQHHKGWYHQKQISKFKCKLLRKDGGKGKRPGCSS